MARTPTFEQDTPATEPVRDRRRATMSGSRRFGLLGLAAGGAVGALSGWSPWLSAIVGFIVFAELPDLVYRLRARRGDTSPLLPAWDPSEAYLVTLRRWRRSDRVGPGPARATETGGFAPGEDSDG